MEPDSIDLDAYPQSYFRLNRVAALQQTRGRLTLLNFTLSVERDGQSITRELPGGADYIAALREHFGVQLDARYEDLLPFSA